MPTPAEFQIGIVVTDQNCAGPNGCVYKYRVEPKYLGLHPLPDNEIKVIYQVTGGHQPQTGDFTVQGDQARVLQDVPLEGPPGAQLKAPSRRSWDSAVNVWLLFVLVVLASVAGRGRNDPGCESCDSRRLSGTRTIRRLSPFVTTVALVYGALLGFTVVVAWEQFSSAEVNVANEASTLATMYRQTVAMPVAGAAGDPGSAAQVHNCGAGARMEKAGENRGRHQRHARSAITDMYRVIGRQDPDAVSSAINSEFLGQLTVLASERNTRVLDAEPRIPWLLWCGLAFGGVLLVGLTGFMRLASTRGHIVLSGAVSVLLGLLLFLVYCLDHPFGSSSRNHACPVRALGRGVRRRRLGEVINSAIRSVGGALRHC